MRKPRKQSLEIRNFILENVGAHPKDISAHVSSHFGISRPAVLGHIKKLINDGVLESKGTTRGRRYKLKPLVEETFSFKLSPGTEEDKVWRHLVRPLLSKLPENIMRICEYGMNEMINNAIDHSEGTKATIHIQQSAVNVEFLLHDNGVGIFNKIQRDLGLDEPRQAILELSKGKLTTDPSRHTGEGIFFVSRMFDRFVIYSEGLFYSLSEIGYEDIPDLHDSEPGTKVSMSISLRSKRTSQGVFDRYASEADDDFSFSKTDVPVSLARFGGDNLVSRSQARRLLNRLHEFRQITLDFTGIDSVGQSFADEIFRVYARNYPDIELSAINTNPGIEKMILRASSRVP
jgi:anti-sigma regulatory factor (Ser/Thr protein kinase)